MLNLRTRRILLTCDILWLKKTYGEYIIRKDNIKAETYIRQEK